MTQTITIREGRANVFVALEHSNSEVVGIRASGSAASSEPLTANDRRPCQHSRRPARAEGDGSD